MQSRKQPSDDEQCAQAEQHDTHDPTQNIPYRSDRRGSATGWIRRSTGSDPLLITLVDHRLELRVVPPGGSNVVEAWQGRGEWPVIGGPGRKHGPGVRPGRGVTRESGFLLPGLFRDPLFLKPVPEGQDR